MKTLMKKIIIIAIFTIGISSCKTIEQKSNYKSVDNSIECNILDSIVNVTHDTIGSTSIFSSKKYGLYYNGYQTDEYAPVITKDGNIETLWFTSSRVYNVPQTYSFFWDSFPVGWIFGNTPEAKIINPIIYPKFATKTDRYHLGDVFYTVRDISGDTLLPWEGWSKPEILITKDEKFDTYIRGPLTTVDGSDFIIAAERDISSIGVSKNFMLYSFSKTKGFSNPEPIKLNDSDKYWESQPALSQDGKILYFVSNRPCSKKGLNIWYSMKDANGNWDNPLPLDAINTDADETYPHCGIDGRFYFSSNRTEDNKGGFDIYVAEFDKDSIWKNPKNIKGYVIKMKRKKITFPSDINTSNDEISPFISDLGKSIYYSKTDRNGKYDLYACKIEQDTIITNDTCKVKIVVNVKINDRCSSIDVDKTIDDSYQTVPVIIFCDDKPICTIRHNQSVLLKPNTKYVLKVMDPLFKPFEEQITTPDCDEPKTFSINVSVVGRNLGTIIIFEKSRIPFFIIGYWRPTTSENYKVFQDESRSGKLNSANVDPSWYDYKGTVIPFVDKEFKEKIYDVIEEKLPILPIKKIVCGDDLVLRITIDGYTDPRSYGLGGVYTGDQVELESEIGNLIIPYKQPFWSNALKDNTGKTIKFNIDGISGGQSGNVILSMLRAYYTKETINKYLHNKIPNFDSSKIKFVCNGKGVYRKDPNATYEEQRRIEISLDVVPREFDFEKRTEVKDICAYYTELVFDSKKEAEDIKRLLKDYSPTNYFDKNDLSIAEIENNPGKYRLYSKYFPNLGSAQTLANEIQKSFSNLPSYIKKRVETPIFTEGNQYVVSLGVYNSNTNAEKYVERLRGLIHVGAQSLPDNTYSIRTDPINNIKTAEYLKKKYLEILKTNKIPSYIDIIKLDDLYEGSSYCNAPKQPKNEVDKPETEKVNDSPKAESDPENNETENAISENVDYQRFAGVWEGPYTIYDKPAKKDHRNVSIYFDKIIGNKVSGKKQIILSSGEVFLTTNFKGKFSKAADGKKIVLKLEEIGEGLIGEIEVNFHSPNYEEGKGTWRAKDGTKLRFLTIKKMN